MNLLPPTTLHAACALIKKLTVDDDDEKPINEIKMETI